MNGIVRARPRGLLYALALILPSLAATARADEPTAQDCLSANEQAIDLRGRHQLIEARAQLLICANASCPAEIRDECVHRVDDVNGAIPTIVFDAKDARGHDLDGVSVTMDGGQFTGQIEGVAVPVDPGKHTFSFQAPGAPPVSREILIVEGAKERHETVTFGGPLSSPPSLARDADAPTGSLQPILGWSAVGAGAVGIGLGIFFEIARSNKLNDANGICPGNDCSIPGETRAQSDAEFTARIHDLTSDANAAGVRAVIAFAAGGVLVAGGAALVLTARAKEKPVAFVPVVAPGLGVMTVTGKF